MSTTSVLILLLTTTGWLLEGLHKMRSSTQTSSDWTTLFSMGYPTRCSRRLIPMVRTTRRTPGQKFSSRLALRGTGRMSSLVCRLAAELSPVVSGLADESQGVLVIEREACVDHRQWFFERLVWDCVDVFSDVFV